eukprot:3129751-Amphidinium_carterae.2
MARSPARTPRVATTGFLSLRLLHAEHHDVVWQAAEVQNVRVRSTMLARMKKYRLLNHEGPRLVANFCVQSSGILPE